MFLAVRELGDDIFDAESLGGKVYQAPLTKTLPDIRQLVLGRIDALWRGGHFRPRARKARHGLHRTQ
jgi:hypothetical protein